MARVGVSTWDEGVPRGSGARAGRGGRPARRRPRSRPGLPGGRSPPRWRGARARSAGASTPRRRAGPPASRADLHSTPRRRHRPGAQPATLASAPGREPGRVLYLDGMIGGFDRGRFREKPVRPADPAVRRANLNRIARLFRAYRVRLSVVLGLILFSAAI